MSGKNRTLGRRRLPANDGRSPPKLRRHFALQRGTESFFSPLPWRHPPGGRGHWVNMVERRNSFSSPPLPIPPCAGVYLPALTLAKRKWVKLAVSTLSSQSRTRREPAISKGETHGTRGPFKRCVIISGSGASVRVCRMRTNQVTTHAGEKWLWK